MKTPDPNPNPNHNPQILRTHRLFPRAILLASTLADSELPMAMKQVGGWVEVGRLGCIVMRWVTVTLLMTSCKDSLRYTTLLSSQILL